MYDQAEYPSQDRAAGRLETVVQQCSDARDYLAKTIQQLIERLGPLEQPDETADKVSMSVPSPAPLPRGRIVANLEDHIDSLRSQARRLESLMSRLDI